jgi:hypothetical protein
MVQIPETNIVNPDYGRNRGAAVRRSNAGRSFGERHSGEGKDVTTIVAGERSRNYSEAFLANLAIRALPERTGVT